MGAASSVNWQALFCVSILRRLAPVVARGYAQCFSQPPHPTPLLRSRPRSRRIASVLAWSSPSSPPPAARPASSPTPRSSSHAPRFSPMPHWHFRRRHAGPSSALQPEPRLIRLRLGPHLAFLCRILCRLLFAAANADAVADADASASASACQCQSRCQSRCQSQRDLGQRFDRICFANAVASAANADASAADADAIADADANASASACQCQSRCQSRCHNAAWSDRESE